jgi:hypothetical protein
MLGWLQVHSVPIAHVKSPVLPTYADVVCVGSIADQLAGAPAIDTLPMLRCLQVTLLLVPRVPECSQAHHHAHL